MPRGDSAPQGSTAAKGKRIKGKTAPRRQRESTDRVGEHAEGSQPSKSAKTKGTKGEQKREIDPGINVDENVQSKGGADLRAQPVKSKLPRAKQKVAAVPAVMQEDTDRGGSSTKGKKTKSVKMAE